MIPANNSGCSPSTEGDCRPTHIVVCHIFNVDVRRFIDSCVSDASALLPSLPLASLALEEGGSALPLQLNLYLSD